MKVAIPIWRSRIAPVLDTARRFTVVEVVDGLEVQRTETAFPEETTESAPGQPDRLACLGADVVLCGAVSRPLTRTLTACGIRVVPHLAGDIETVLAAYRDGDLEDPSLAMPGCQRNGGRRRRCPQRQCTSGSAPAPRNTKRERDENRHIVNRKNT